MSDVIKFTPKPLSNDEAMRRYREECAKNGEPASPFKCKPGDPNTITTADGDVLYVGEPANGIDVVDPEFAQLDLSALFNIREWVADAVRAKGAKILGAGIGVGGTMGIADVQMEIDSCEYNIEIRPLPRS